MLGRWEASSSPSPCPCCLLSPHPWGVPNPPTARTRAKPLWVTRGSCLTARCNTTPQSRTGNEGGCICRGNLSAQTAITCAGAWPEPRSSEHHRGAGRRQLLLRCCGVKHSSGCCLGPRGSCPNLVGGGWSPGKRGEFLDKGKIQLYLNVDAAWRGIEIMQI